jgi:hypothetical protein
LHLGNPDSDPNGTVDLKGGLMANVTINDHENNPMIEMMSVGDGSSLQIFDLKGHVHAALQYTSGSTPELILRDERGLAVNPASTGSDEPGSRRP